MAPDQHFELRFINVGVGEGCDKADWNSDHADRFAGGVFTHSALRTFDYHRFHSPVAGTVREARIVQGQAYLDVDVIDSTAHAGAEPRRVLHAVEGTGYQFLQTRGLVVIESAIGLVACLPVGMAQVSSVVITAEVGAVLRKGEEMGYFQFGGSDFVMVFEQRSAVRLGCVAEAHVCQGEEVARAEVILPSVARQQSTPAQTASSKGA